MLYINIVQNYHQHSKASDNMMIFQTELMIIIDHWLRDASISASYIRSFIQECHRTFLVFYFSTVFLSRHDIGNNFRSKVLLE